MKILLCIPNRGYYTWPLKIRIYLGVSVGNISIKFISPNGHVMLYLLCWNRLNSYIVTSSHVNIIIPLPLSGTIVQPHWRGGGGESIKYVHERHERTNRKGGGRSSRIRTQTKVLSHKIITEKKSPSFKISV